MNRDLSALLADQTWLFPEREKIIQIEEREFQCTDECALHFPIITNLLKKARVTKIKYENAVYDLYGWNNLDSQSFGWLCSEPITEEQHMKPLHPDHILLLQNFGGIMERWNEPDDTWLCNLDHAFTYAHTEIGFADLAELLMEICEEERIEINLNPQDYLTFAVEANGNITMYHRKTAQVLMFAHDHCFDHVDTLAGFPEFTFYQIRDCYSFTDWVEHIAKQWLQHIK